MTKEEMWEAYTAGTATLGFDFVEEVAQDYEDSSVSPDQRSKLEAVGYEFSDDYGSVGCDEYVAIFLFLVKLGNPAFSFETICLVKMDIGGYGLF